MTKSLRHFPYPRELVFFAVSRHFPYSRDFASFHVSGHFPNSRDFAVSRDFPCSRDFDVVPVSRHSRYTNDKIPWIWKLSWNRKTTKFLCFQQKRYPRGAPNDLLDVQVIDKRTGVTIVIYRYKIFRHREGLVSWTLFRWNNISVIKD